MTRDDERGGADCAAARPGAGRVWRAAASERYRWTCPYCGTARTNASGGEGGLESAIAALRSHIQASDGAEHGPRNEMPADAVDLAEHVRYVDGGRGPSDSR